MNKSEEKQYLSRITDLENRLSNLTTICPECKREFITPDGRLYCGIICGTTHWERNNPELAVAPESLEKNMFNNISRIRILPSGKKVVLDWDYKRERYAKIRKEIFLA